jgi:hypothetical protein
MRATARPAEVRGRAGHGVLAPAGSRAEVVGGIASPRAGV